MVYTRQKPSLSATISPMRPKNQKILPPTKKKNKAENKRQKKHSEAYQKFRSRFALGKHFVLNVLSRHEKEKQASAVIYVT
jgi:hypothetical protein